MIKTALLGLGTALAPLAVFAQVTLTSETSSVGSLPHYIDTTLAAVLDSAGVATVQITEGATLSNSVQAVAEGQLDMASAPLILPFYLLNGFGPYISVDDVKKRRKLAGNIRVLFFHAGSHLIFGHYNSASIEDIQQLDGLHIWNGPPRGHALALGRAMIEILSGLRDGEGYEGIQSPWPDTVSTITGGGVDAWTLPEGVPSDRQIQLAADGGITLYDLPSDLLNSKLGQHVVNSVGQVPFSMPVEDYRAAYAGSDITITTDDDTFDSYAAAFGEFVSASMDEQLAFDIVTAFLEGQERFETSSPVGPNLALSFGNIDGVSQGACGLIPVKMHPGCHSRI